MEIFMPRLSPDLRSGTLDIDLPYAFDEEIALKGFRFSSDTLIHADLPRLDLSDCKFERCRMTENELRGIAADNIVFRDCDLTACRFDGGFFRQAVFIGCRMTGAVFQDCGFKEVLFEDCMLNFARFSGCRLDHAIFRQCRMEQAVFSGAALTKTALEDCTLTGADFMHAKLKGMDFTRSQIGGAYFNVPDLKGVTFNPDQAVMLIKTLGILVKE